MSVMVDALILASFDSHILQVTIFPLSERGNTMPDPNFEALSPFNEFNAVSNFI